MADRPGRRQRYWHGGQPGLRPGDRLLPPDTTGNSKALTVTARLTGVDGELVRTDRVYLTTDRGAARAYAACYPDGALYQAEPVGEVDPDPDAPGVSVCCGEAVVTAVYDPCVLWRERGPRWTHVLLRGGTQ